VIKIPTIKLPWSAWHEEREIELPLPSGWTVFIASIAGAPRGPGLDEALDHPIGSPRIEELCAGRSSAAIAVEDITRPAPTGPALEATLDRLASGGIPAGRVAVIVALGGHAPMRLGELRAKVGSRVLDSCDVSNHHPYENLVDLGKSRSGIPILINRTFHDREVRLAVGSVVPHPYAGFGGGGKIVLPGLAGIETLEMNHRPAVTGLAGAGLAKIEGNQARAEMEEIALEAGLHAVVNIVPDARRDPLGYYYGQPVAAHRAAVALAREAYQTRALADADAVLMNAYPKDGELLQVGNAFNPCRAAGGSLVREGGTVIVAAACHDGVGHHSLHGPGMRLYHEPVERPYLAGRELIVFAPALSTFDVRKSFWTGYPHARRWEEVLAILEKRHPHGGRMTVFPTAPLSLPVVTDAGQRTA
jgi:nickel-dependent lactate racemase